MVLSNIMAILCVFYGANTTSDTLTIPMAVGYFLALGFRVFCYLIGDLLLSRIPLVQAGHKALKDDKLINGLFLVCGALTIVATNEGSIILLIILAYVSASKVTITHLIFSSAIIRLPSYSASLLWSLISSRSPRSHSSPSTIWQSMNSSTNLPFTLLASTYGACCRTEMWHK